ncbi:MAG: aminotransferase class III-fold pyridoxal phosphate-dependent enzyme [Gordonia sp. (in: high G+C Gram-positive bacteria)]
MHELLGRADVLAAQREHLGPGGSLLAELIGAPIEDAASGAIVTTPEGDEYIDCGGYSVFLHGHSHPRVVEAVVDQVRRRALATRLLIDPVTVQAAQRLADVVPDHLRRVKFANSGAEATEVAIKLARLNGRSRMITTRGGYHGKTTGALSVTPTAKYQEPFGQLLPAEVVEYGDIEALRTALDAAPHGTSAFIVEPIQGEAGVQVPPAGYLEGVSRLCREAGALLIVDEIQTGMGRCGTTWAHPAECRPDIMLIGKALSGGVVPCSAIVATESAFGALNQDPGLHSSTFAGGPIQAAAICAAVDVMVDEDLPAAAAKTGKRLVDGIRSFAAEHPEAGIRDVRGAGVLIGVEFSSPLQVAEMIAELLARGVIVNHSLNSSGVLRLTPPAVLTEEQCERVLAAFAAAATSPGVVVDPQTIGNGA